MGWDSSESHSSSIRIQKHSVVSAHSTSSNPTSAVTGRGRSPCAMPELLSRSSARAKPPAYDLSFSHVEHDLWQWPIEAKVVLTPKALGEYLRDVQDKFIAGIAAPMIGEGAMIGYLLSGDDNEFF